MGDVCTGTGWRLLAKGQEIREGSVTALVLAQLFKSCYPTTTLHTSQVPLGRQEGFPNEIGGVDWIGA